MSLLSIQNVIKTYGDKRAVNNISLEVPEGTIFGLLGPNGAGKTTLIRMITNILYQDSGQIVLRDVSASDRPAHIGYMPEERGLYKKMKVGEQLLYLARLKRMPADKAKQQIDKWFSKFEISDWWDKKVDELSKGMQQKVQFIATVIHEPKLIILDEPFSGLDPINTNLIKDQIYELKQEGATILFSTHRMEQVEEVCEQIALINQGEVILSGEVAGLKQRFKSNQYRCTFRLPLALEINDWQAAAPFNVISTAADRGSIVLQLHQGQQADVALNYLLRQQLPINGFEEILPTLNEIFIAQVNGATEAKRADLSSTDLLSSPSPDETNEHA